MGLNVTLNQANSTALRLYFEYLKNLNNFLGFFSFFFFFETLLIEKMLVVENDVEKKGALVSVSGVPLAGGIFVPS